MKIINRKVLGFSIALALNIGTAQALSFSDTIFFGDSLSDSGAYKGNPDSVSDGKFTTSPGNVWTENLADIFNTEAFANNPDNPDNTNPNGTNFSQGGAQVILDVGIGQTPSPQGAWSIRRQVDLYLNGVDQADRNALYSIWGGANDVFFNMFMVGSGLPVDASLVNIGGSAMDLLGQAQRLSDAGARYILVPNLPDIGATPAMLLDVVATAAKDNPNGNAALIAAATILAVGGADSGQVKMDALAAAEQILGLPSGSLNPFYQQNVALGSGLSGAFNTVLLAGANAGSANLIMLDVYGMLGEVSANPGAFGFINVTGTACTTASSLACSANTVVDPRAPGVFLFADGVHPTTAGHKLISDYAVSVISAPALIANLPEVAIGQLRQHQQGIEMQMRMGFGEGWSFFANGGMGSQDIEADQAWDSSSNDARLMLGGAWRYNQQWVLGAALEKSYSDVDFAKDKGDFELDAVQLSAFANFQGEMLFANAIASVGLNNDFNDVQRIIKLGTGVRAERGSTNADSYALKALLGAVVFKNEQLQAGPFASINYQSVDVDAYREKGSRATSMNFGSQNRDSLLLEAGMFADYSLAGGTLHGAFSYESELDDDGRTVTAGLNNLQGNSFSLYDIQGSDYFWKLDLGYSIDMGKNVALGINYALRDGEGGSGDQYVNVGIDIGF